MRISRRRGSALVEIAMLMPIILLLLVGMAQLARITYIYYTLRKTVYSVARYVGTQQGVNFCDAADPTIAAGINFGLTGTTDASQPVFVTGLTADMIAVTAERYDPVGLSLGACSCDVTGCDAAQGGSVPDYIVVSIPNGYLVPVRIPLLPQLDPIALKPQVKVPYAGT